MFKYEIRRIPPFKQRDVGSNTGTSAFIGNYVRNLFIFNGGNPHTSNLMMMCEVPSPYWATVGTTAQAQLIEGTPVPSNGTYIV